MEHGFKRFSLAATVAKLAISILVTAACTRTDATGKPADAVNASPVTVVPNAAARAAESAAEPVPAPASGPASTSASEPAARTVTVPDNTVLDVRLATPLASHTSRVEQAVRATVASPVVVRGNTVIPAGSTLTGHVTNVRPSGKVKGRAELAFRFTRLTAGGVTYDIDSRPLTYVAASTKKNDAAKIGTGAGVGAVIGAITGGKKGAAVGGAIGAGAGTGVVLATEGKEISLAQGRRLKVPLTHPLTIRTK